MKIYNYFFLYFLLFFTTITGYSYHSSETILSANNSSYSEQKVDYSIWKMILKRYVNADGNVNYDGLKKKEQTLDAFLKVLEATKINMDWKDSEKIAFWINVYNAYTMKLILDNYPVNSIKEIKKPWDKKFFTIDGKFLSLGDVEHEILRKQFTEPRIHFAINCASKSCPRVLQIPYRGNNLNKLLDRQTREYINNPEQNEITEGHYKLSKLFSWFGKDFKNAEGTIVNFINKYSKTPIKNQKNKGFLEYNWKLNS